ncbi:MAG: acylneuraminate cytidylyltransferase family protein [Patescibacteria group bacterium]
MNKKYKILGVIPVRGGSKGVPRKNIKLLNGKPLLYYMLTSALKSKTFDYVAVSSEDDEILDIAGRYGKKNKKFILIKRPKNLALDSTPTLPVIQHAVVQLEKEKKIKFDYIVLLHAVSPLTYADDIDKVVEKLIRTKADSVVSVYEVPGGYHPVKMKKIVKDRLYQYVPSMPEKSFRRQDFDSIYKRAGGIYAVKRDVVMKNLFSLGFFCGKVTRPYIITPPERAIDIDDEVDFFVAEKIGKKLRIFK